MTRAIAVLCLIAASFAVRAEPPAEPKVEHIVVEDDNARIEELRVRGQTQKVVVTPKNSTLRPYEITTGNASRDPSYGQGASRSTAGQRVWNIFNF